MDDATHWDAGSTPFLARRAVRAVCDMILCSLTRTPMRAKRASAQHSQQLSGCWSASAATRAAGGPVGIDSPIEALLGTRRTIKASLIHEAPLHQPLRITIRDGAYPLASPGRSVRLRDGVSPPAHHAPIRLPRHPTHLAEVQARWTAATRPNAQVRRHAEPAARATRAAFRHILGADLAPCCLADAFDRATHSHHGT